MSNVAVIVSFSFMILSLSGCGVGSGRLSAPDVEDRSDVAIDVAISRVQALASENQRLRGILAMSEDEAIRRMAKMADDHSRTVAAWQSLVARLAVLSGAQDDLTSVLDSEVRVMREEDVSRLLFEVGQRLDQRLDALHGRVTPELKFCPMHPTAEMTADGRCAVCGMDWQKK